MFFKGRDEHVITHANLRRVRRPQLIHVGDRELGLVAEHGAEPILGHALIAARVPEAIGLADQVHAAATRGARPLNRLAVLQPLVADGRRAGRRALQDAARPTEQRPHVERLQRECRLLLDEPARTTGH